MIIYPELSYKLMGVLFTVHRKLGNSYQERYYQRAIDIELNKAGISFKKELQIKLLYEDKPLGKHFIDFVIENKIALEIKTVPFLIDGYYKQLLSYLDSAELKLGILANFRTHQLTYKRLINPRIKI